MSFRRLIVLTLLLVASIAASTRALAQTPADYQAVLTTLGRTGDFKDGVLKVNIPRGDLKVVIGQRAAPTPFGFGGWVALTKGAGGTDVLMGDLVLTEDEVNPVLKALRSNGINVVAIHHHMTGSSPTVYFLHYYGTGGAAKLATGVKAAIDQLGKQGATHP